jgi:hypothetical protein
MNESQETEPMAQEISITIKTTEEMADAIGKLSFDSDRNKSEIIRACICLGLPILKTNNSLIYRLDFSEFNAKSK